MLVELQPVEKALVKVANAIVSNIRHEAVHNNESPSDGTCVTTWQCVRSPKPHRMTEVDEGKC